MNEREFAPGFRISWSDGAVLAAGAAAVALAPRELALVAGVAVGHFFLFCNVFRIRRGPELLWAGVFVALAGATLAWGRPGWAITVGSALALAAGLIAREMRYAGYHGVGWRRVNPGLPEWWRARQGGRRESSGKRLP